eukprot:gene7404-9099_t
MTISNRLNTAPVKDHKTDDDQRHRKANVDHQQTTTNIINSFSHQQIDDCGTCTLLGITDKKNEMFKLISEVSPEIDDPKFWEPLPNPPDAIELGNSGWTLLHTMASYYPNNPSQTKKEEMRQFLYSFSKVYPCNVCAKDFQHILETTPPQLNSQQEFAKWMCGAHNHVNSILGKPRFDCNQVDKRWKLSGNANNITDH